MYPVGWGFSKPVGICIQYEKLHMAFSVIKSGCMCKTDLVSVYEYPCGGQSVNVVGYMYSSVPVRVVHICKRVSS